MALKTRFAPLIARAKAEYAKFSGRERLMVLAATLFVLGWAVTEVSSSVSAAFASQREEEDKVRRSLNALPEIIGRYSQLKSRRQAIEARFKSIEINEGVPSFVEDLVRTKLGAAATNLTINDQTSTKLGDEYELLPYAIRFNTTNLSATVDFLKELVEGKKPLLLKELEINKTPSGDRLEIKMRVSSIRRAAK